MSAQDDIEVTRHDYKSPYGAKQPIPTVQKYREIKAQERTVPSGYGTTGGIAEDDEDGEDDDESGRRQQAEDEVDHAQNQDKDKVDTTEHHGSHDPKQRRKQFQNKSTERTTRRVTDPVTHLQIKIRDYTGDDLKSVDERYKRAREAEHAIAHDPKQLSKSDRVDSSMTETSQQQYDEHEAMEHVFPPPDYDLMRKELSTLYGRAIGASVVAVAAICLTALSLGIPPVAAEAIPKKRSFTFSRGLGLLASLTVGAGIAFAVVYSIQSWVQKKVESICEDGVWNNPTPRREHLRSKEPETVAWLNKLLGSIWPLVNPDLFASVADTLEDVMQASLPKFVRMVSVEDLGQGSESFKILGIKSLPRGAASRTVDSDGKPKDPKEKERVEDNQKGQKEDLKQSGATKDSSKDSHSRGNEVETSDDKNEQENDPNLVAGMEAEDGEFINMEIAFAYRAVEVKRVRDRAKNAHLYMAFYLPGNIKIPVWVELRGLVGCIRTRLQLTPDPPFIGMCTLTLLGQPKVEMSCIPLVKRGINILDLPVISNFVRSAVDAAMAEYVAPKSMTLDLNQMLMGDDFKKDTTARGVIVVLVKNAYDFKEGDTSIPLIRDGSSDAYVSIGWAKFGKPLFSTRVIVSDMHPYWQEHGYLLVSPQELHAGEKLRLQLWDSDRLSADDDLGRIEVDLKEIIRDNRSHGKMWDRTDQFEALKAGESMPGRLNWSVGYFTKTRLQDQQVERHCGEKGIKTVKQLKEESFKDSKQKLREAARDESAEIDQLKQQDFEAKSIDMITNSPPLEERPSGILSIQIHQVTGLELEALQRPRDNDGGGTEEEVNEDSEKLPDSYCNIILNHEKIYKTRTKPRNQNPFFNAATERFIRDWRTTSLIISVRDARVHEDDAILGIAVISVADQFRSRKTSRFVDFFPLAGGIGYGRIRVSLVFRSVELQAPKAALGWDYGTLEVTPAANCGEGLPEALKKERLRFSTSLGRARMFPTSSSSDAGTMWAPRRKRPIRLGVRQRHCSALLIEFRHSIILRRDPTTAFSILWLKDIPDEEEVNLDLPVYKGDVKRAQANILPEEEHGEKVGRIQIKARFWRGLGKWHNSLAHGRQEVGNVMEVLECAVDNGDLESIVGDKIWYEKRREIAEEDGSADEESSDDGTDDENDDGANDKENWKEKHGSSEAKSAGKSDGKGQDNSAQLHRKNRGIMQLKGARTLKWMKHKVENAVDDIEQKFDLSNRQPDIETEV